MVIITKNGKSWLKNWFKLLFLAENIRLSAIESCYKARFKSWVGTVSSRWTLILVWMAILKYRNILTGCNFRITLECRLRFWQTQNAKFVHLPSWRILEISLTQISFLLTASNYNAKQKFVYNWITWKLDILNENWHK